MEIEWLGGPHDGGRMAVPDGARFVDVVQLVTKEHGNIRTVLALAGTPVPKVAIRVPIRQRRAVWSERTESGK